ncbi:MAG: ATP-binding protein [Candidatus Binatia bacterium]
MTRSLRTRLLLWVLIPLVPLSLAGAWLLIQAFGNRLLHDIDVALEEEAETVAVLVGSTGNTAPSSDLLARIAAERDIGTPKYITVARAGTVVAAVPAEAGAVLASGQPGLRVMRYESEGPDGPLTVSVGVSAAEAVQAKRKLVSLLAVGAPLVLALFGTGLWFVVARTLRPLEVASRQLETIGAENLSIRVPVHEPLDEVGRMVTVLNRLLDRLDQAVSELRRFTADAAHELRTPLTVLHTGLEVALARNRTAADYRAALADALVSTDRMVRLAEDLLTLARLGAAGAPRGAAPVELGSILEELADSWVGAAVGKTVAVQVSGISELRVRGNTGDLYRLFNNLIDNAVRHSKGGGTVSLTAGQRGEWVQVSVSDEGPGIPPAELPLIFDRFYRARRERQGQAGTGLGLSIAQEIARTHGGRISAANREGGGCRFTVFLPVAGQPEHSAP